MKNYLDALKRRKEETGESGFSLIELIVVVVILGILAAIAIPVFLNLQGQAAQSAQDSVAGNAASQVASNLAQGEDPNLNLAGLSNGGEYTISTIPASATISDFCVTVSSEGPEDSTSGPGC
jgi:type IV pilus assembly protein PilA